ncbi:MAG: TerB family tellurite resistance protein [Gammaproteobacteria bacterium]|nr:TerB family tellurite resistance protein [Gammaproteobacteria bacterium]
MIKKLKQLLLGMADDATSGLDRQNTLELAVAALMVEMARTDFNEEQSENEEIKRLLKAHFELTEQESARLLGRAQTAADEAVSLHEFMCTLRSVLDSNEKQKVILMLWKIALADNRLDKYEDHLVGKMAQLLYVPRVDVLRLKHQSQMENAPPL